MIVMNDYPLSEKDMAQAKVRILSKNNNYSVTELRSASPLNAVTKVNK